MYRKCNRCKASYWASLKSSCQCRNLKKTPKTSCPSLTGYGHHKRLNSAFISQIHNKRINFLINSSIYSIVSKIISDNSAASTIVIDTPSSPSTPNSPVSSTTLNGKFETFLLIFVDFYFSSISKTITLYIYIYKKKTWMIKFHIQLITFLITFVGDLGSIFSLNYSFCDDFRHSSLS